MGTFNKLTENIRSNLELNYQEFGEGKIVLESYPTRVQISPTERCNLDCIQCYRKKYKDSLIKEDMKIGILDTDTIQKATLAIEEAWIVSGGEPFLYNEFGTMINFLKDREIQKIYTISNGTVINDDMAELLVKSEFSYIKLSFDGARKETIEKIRGEGVYDRLIYSVRRINHYKKKHHSKYPKLIINFVVMRNNYFELTLLVKLAMELEIDAIECHKCLNLNDNIKNLDINGYEKEYEIELNKAKEVALNCNIEIRDSIDLGEVKEKGCIEPWRFMLINQQGDVYPCCHIYGTPLGNVYKQTFEEIWNGEEVKKMRKDIQEKGYADICVNTPCPKMIGAK